MTPLLAAGAIAFSLGITLVIASIVGAATRSLSRTLQRRRMVARADAQRLNATRGAMAPPRRAIRRSRRQSVTLRRARRY